MHAPANYVIKHYRAYWTSLPDMNGKFDPSSLLPLSRSEVRMDGVAHDADKANSLLP